MYKEPMGRRRFLRASMETFMGLGIAAAVLDPLDYLFPIRVAAEELPPGAIYRATGFYERDGLGHETLVAVVLVPLNRATAPSIQDGTGLDRRDLGSGPLETFQGRVGGMHRRDLFDHGALRAVVYSARTIEGDYAEEKRYLFGRSEVNIENPRARASRGEGRGSDGGNGGNSGGGSM
jgi:hypothetical protein